MEEDRAGREVPGSACRPVGRLGRIANEMARRDSRCAVSRAKPVVCFLLFLRDATHHEGADVPMLRITVVADAGEPIVLKLEGHVDGEGGALLERECEAWLAAEAVIALDLTAVRFVNRAGTAALGRLARAGVEIRCGAGVVASVLECEGIAVVDVSSD